MPLQSQYSFRVRLTLVCVILLVFSAIHSIERPGSVGAQEAKPTPIPPSQIREELVAEVSPGSEAVALRFLNTGGVDHVAWVEQSKSGKTIWLDGKQVGGPFDDVKYPALFRGTGALGFVASRKSKWLLSVGGREYGSEYTKITGYDVGAQGELVAGVCREKQCRLLLDGRETGPTFEDIGAPDFSPKGDHYVYFGKRNEKWVPLVDGKDIGVEMDGWWTHRWWPEGSRLAIAAQLNGHSTWIIDRQPGPLFDVISDLALSRDGEHYAYGGANANAGFKKQEVIGSMVVDGKSLEPSYTGRGMLGGWTWLGGKGQLISKGLKSLSVDFHGLSDPVFTAKGELAFGLRLGEGRVTVRVGDREGPMFDDILSSILVASEGEHIAYVAKKEEAFVEVRDQQPGPTFPAKRAVAAVRWIAMTESGRLSYELVRGGAEFKEGRSQRALRRVVLDGVEGPEYDALGVTTFRLSETSDQYAYIVVGAEGTRDRLVLNGHESKLYDDIVAGSLTFVPPTGARFVARQERRLLRVTIDLRSMTTE